MRILLGNNTLSLLAGSETWTLTMAKELVRLGHEVTAYSKDLGLIATLLEGFGVRCVNKFNDDTIRPYSQQLVEEMNFEFDVIICNHHDISTYLRQCFKDTPMITTIHGILHQDSKTGQIFPEHPAIGATVDKFVGVSEEVQKTLKDLYKIDAEVIRNPIDLNTFKKEPVSVGEDGETLVIKNMMINSNYQSAGDEVLKPIKDSSLILNAELRAIGVNFQPCQKVEKVVAEADVIVGMGRSVLEGIASGRLGVVHGRWGTGGVITLENIKKLAWFNFSGRNSNGEMKSGQEIANSIKEAYNMTNINEVYEYVKENHDVKVVAAQYLALAEKVIEQRNAF